MKVQTQIRIEPELKKQANEIFAKLGLDMSTAVNLFLYQVVLRKGLPFHIDLSSNPIFEDELTQKELEHEIMKGVGLLCSSSVRARSVYPHFSGSSKILLPGSTKGANGAL